ncbi:hypothetical protein PG994_010385 [Apiospora phragmitis]|uniref:Uncharacterized protein n=1 Tax=Apiospora phragmitis TaxID=2905665 RepID=A0ABR1TPQ7_9PEZI
MAANATVDADNFANNAFTNLAPLLTLFGDEVTKQFLATSMGLPDAVLLGIAPIGIMTIIVSAIRVGRSRLMNKTQTEALMATGLETPDDEEKEILSSTSANVREIWIGNRVVRQTGASKSTAFIFNQNWHTPFQEWYPNWKMRSLDKYFEERPDQIDPLITPKPTLRGRADIVSPNITLNVQGAIPDMWVVAGFAIIGLSLQALVMAIIAIVAYKWKLLRSGKVVANYGWAIGNSTRRVFFQPRTAGGGEPASIVLLQEAMTEQNIPAYAIRLIEPNVGYILSRRSPPSSRARDIIVMIGAALALGGFVCQNIGTSELQYSAGLAQLGLTLVMTLLRAWLRSKVGDPPNEIQELHRGFGACDLATKLTEYECYMPFIHLNGTDHSRYHWTMKSEVRRLFEQRGEESQHQHQHQHQTVITHLLQIHAKLAYHESDALQAAQVAESCYKAMKEIMQTIFQCESGMARSKVQMLNPLTPEPPCTPGYELVMEDDTLASPTDPDRATKALSRHVVLELMSSFFLAATTQFKTEFIVFMKDDPGYEVRHLGKHPREARRLPLGGGGTGRRRPGPS